MKAVTDDSLSENTTISMPRSNDDPRRHVQILPERVGAVSQVYAADADAPSRSLDPSSPATTPARTTRGTLTSSRR